MISDGDFRTSVGKERKEQIDDLMGGFSKRTSDISQMKGCLKTSFVKA